MTKEQEDKAMIFYLLGFTDRQVGEEIGCSQGQIFRWRGRNNLKANGLGGFTSAQEEIALKLYRAKYIDREIAAEMGVSLDTIRYWRKQKGLPPNNRLRIKSTTDTKAAIEATQEEIDICLNCNEEKCSGNCYRYFRLMHQIKTKER